MYLPALFGLVTLLLAGVSSCVYWLTTNGYGNVALPVLGLFLTGSFAGWRVIRRLSES